MKKTVYAISLTFTLTVLFLAPITSSATKESVTNKKNTTKVNAPEKFEPMNVCFITINSTEEKKVFEKKLSTGVNKGRFTFRELIPAKNDQGVDWFAKACEQKITCDILAISGEFDGLFFGKSGYDLSISELEEKSCSNNCDGIIGSPKEVFLFGCNTLASKDGYVRNPLEYLDVLLGHDENIFDAARIVEQRYGLVGTSFRDSMRGIFRGVPHIYGFSDIGPSGASARGLIEKYFEKKPNYYDHLMRVEVERINALMGNFSKWGEKNEELGQILSITNFDQCPGIMATDSNDPMIEVFKNICKFYKLKDEPEKGIDLAIDLLQQDDFFIYLPMISDFMGKNSLNKAFHLALASFPAIKNRLLTLLDKTKTPFGKLQLARSLYDFSLISIDDYTEVEKNTLISHLKPPLSVGTLDAICNLDRPGPNNLEDVDLSNDEEDYENIKFPVSPGELDSGVFKDKNAIVALACLKITNNELLDRLYEVANSGDSYDLRNAALDVLLYSEKRLDKLISQCRAQLKEGRSQDDKMSGLLCLLETGHADDNTLVEVEKIIKSNKNLNIWVQRPTGNIEIGLLESSKFKSYEQVKYFFNLVLKQNLEKREENKEIVSIGALAASLPIEEAKMFLADSSISDYEKCKYFEEAFGYDIFIFNENFSEGKMTKMPMALLPKYMDLQRSILLNKRDDSIIIHDYYALSYLDLQNEEDETFLIELIKKEKNKPSNLISNLPLETVSDVIAKFIVEEYHIVDYGYSEPFDNLINYLDYRETLNEKEKVVFRELLENIPNVPIKTKARLKELGVNIN